MSHPPMHRPPPISTYKRGDRVRDIRTLRPGTICDRHPRHETRYLVAYDDRPEAAQRPHTEMVDAINLLPLTVRS